MYRKNTYMKITTGLFCGTAIIGALLGTLVLVVLSYGQKIISEGDPYL